MLKIDGHDIVAIVVVIVIGILIGLGHNSALNTTLEVIALAALGHGVYTRQRKKK